MFVKHFQLLSYGNMLFLKSKLLFAIFYEEIEKEKTMSSSLNQRLAESN